MFVARDPEHARTKGKGEWRFRDPVCGGGMLLVFRLEGEPMCSVVSLDTHVYCTFVFTQDSFEVFM